MATEITQQELDSKIKEVESKIEDLKREKTTLELKQEQLKSQKEELEKEILEKFGTTDLQELEAKKQEFIAKLQEFNL